MKAWLIAAALFAVPAHAAETIWVDATCQTMIESPSDGQFTISKTDGSYTKTCTVVSTVADCKDGSRPKVEFVGDNVVFDGVTLLPKGSPEILCD